MEVQTQFNVNIQDGVPVVQIIGDLDHYNTPRFRVIVSELIDKGHDRIVVDMSAVGFMDSGGMSGIVLALKRLSATRGRLFLANCNPRIIRKLNISGFTAMSDALVLHASLEEAIRDAQTR